MATIVLSEEEYTFFVSLEKDLLARAKTASPRAAALMYSLAKQQSEFLAREEGKRAERARRDRARAERESARLAKQQERLAKMQQASQSGAHITPQQTRENPRHQA